MASFLEKASSALNEAKDSVSASVADAQKNVAASTETARDYIADAQKNVSASVTDAQKTVAETTETVGASLTDAQKTVAETAETAKTEAAGAHHNLTTQAKEVLDGAMSRGIEGAKNLLNVFGEHKSEISTKVLGALSGPSSSTTVANRDLPVSTDNQPLLESTDRGVEKTPWWKNCCGVLDLLKTSTTKTETSTKN